MKKEVYKLRMTNLVNQLNGMEDRTLQVKVFII